MNHHFIALETSSSLCSVALLSSSGGAITCLTRSHEGVGEHAERLLPMVDSLLQEAGIARQDLTAVAFGRGPGGFTGLRVACGVAQGMAFALGIPVLPITSLHAVAVRDFWAAFGQSVHSAGVSSLSRLFVVMQDARMGEVYLAAYEPMDQGGRIHWRERQAPILLDAAQAYAWLLQAYESWAEPQGTDDRERSRPFARVCGDALAAYPSILAANADVPWLERGSNVRPNAESVAHLAWDAWREGRAVPPEQAAPLYVRDKIAYTTHERESGLGGNPKAGSLLPFIDAMQTGHVEDVAQLEHGLQRFPWTHRDFSDGLLAGYAGWVAHRHGHVLGYSMVMYAPDVAQVLVLGVAPDAQRQGIARHLLEHVEKQARLRNLEAVLLEVRPSNFPALQLYDKMGFEKISIRRDYYPAPDGQREDAYVMRKGLAEGGGTDQ
jgi:tRNA threonylcarbamoyladenosine biosynthesis protein TsaB